MNVLFLDLDGVMNNFNGEFIHSDKLEMLEALVSDLNLMIVISSAWRLTRPMSWVIEQFAKAGASQPLIARIIDTTPSNITSRSVAIRIWVERHQRKIKSWVAVDDAPLEMVDYSVKTESFNGLDVFAIAEIRRLYAGQGVM